VPERVRADGNLKAVEKLARLFVPVAVRGHGIQDSDRRLVPGQAENLLRIRNGLQIVGLRAARDQHKVSHFRGGKGGLLIARGCIDDREIDAVFFCLCQCGGQPRGLRVDDDGAV